MDMEFVVTVADCEEDASVQKMQAALEAALRQALIYNVITVTPAEDY